MRRSLGGAGMILVTGASGLLGVSLLGEAQKQGRAVIGLYHQHPLNLPGARLLPVDLADESQVQRIFEELKPDRVIHCAAATNVDWCQEHPAAAFKVNVAASASIARITSRMKVRLLHISTDAVFDGARGHYTETDQPAPVNVYAQTKLQAEKEVLRLDPMASVARINLYGWNAQEKQSLAEWILGRLAQGNEVPGFIDTFFCPILANDLAQFLLALVDANFAGLYHVVGSEAVSKYEFARRVASSFSFDPDKVVAARMADSNMKAPRPRDTSLNTDKICTLLGCAMPDVDSGLRRFAQLRSDKYIARVRAH